MSFIADTGIKDSLENVRQYNLLVKDFPIGELVKAVDLERVREAVEMIFVHFTKKVRLFHTDVIS